ncbi:MAG TPA: hypothetical protein VEW48_18590 [Thermoanaerobaculia bacterium]|nr:hypothetical protein [Thermoanaerobaculia bacterium]
MTLAGTTVAVEGLELDELQREVLGEEITALLAGLHTPQARAPWGDLAVAVEGGTVPEALLPRLESVLEMSLQTGRARKIHGADGEQTLLRLFHRTPRGAAARRSTEAVNAALRTLAGQTLESLLVTSQGPGVFRLGVSTDRCKLALEFDRHGVTVESLEV